MMVAIDQQITRYLEVFQSMPNPNPTNPTSRCFRACLNLTLLTLPRGVSEHVLPRVDPHPHPSPNPNPRLSR